MPIACERTGYEFIGWYYGDQEITENDIVNIAGNYELTARWQEHTYKLSGNYYILTGIGDSTNAKVIVASTYNGKPVREIGERAFANNKTLVSIEIPSSVKVIGTQAFSGCTALTTVYIMSNDVETISNEAFRDCTSLTSIKLPHTMDNSTGVELPYSLRNLGMGAFHGCKAVTRVVISENLTVIGEGVFYDCTALREVVIPRSVTRIETAAFGECSNLETIYYTGEEEEWHQIVIGYDNKYINYALKQYNYVHINM